MNVTLTDVDMLIRLLRDARANFADDKSSPISDSVAAGHDNVDQVLRRLERLRQLYLEELAEIPF